MTSGCLNLAFSFDICSEFEVTGEAVSLIKDNLLDFRDSSGKALRATWFVRADNQLKDMYGDDCYLFTRFGDILGSLKKDGHEIGWHPHIYRQQNGEWVLETGDEALEKNLVASHRAISGHFDISSVRMGEGFHSNRCMELFDRLGFVVDSTAMPGRRRDDDRRFDWSISPGCPYHPSRADYRVPGKDPLRILEVPMSMVPVKASYDAGPLPRYVNLSFRNSLMKEGIKELVRTRDLIVSITHPYELVSNHPEKHPLISFDINEARKNLEYIIRCCVEVDRPYRFVTMSEVPDTAEACE